MGKKTQYTFSSKVWLYPGHAGWHFATVPQKESLQIRTEFAGLQRGWTSYPVQITIGKTTWKTSIFYEKTGKTFLLPLKAEVRNKEGIMIDDTIKIKLQIAL